MKWMNNFKVLQAEQMAFFVEYKQEVVFERVSKTVDILRFLGAIVEMYAPVMVNTAVSLASKDTEEAKAPTKENQEGGEEPKGPDLSGDIIR